MPKLLRGKNHDQPPCTASCPANPDAGGKSTLPTSLPRQISLVGGEKGDDILAHLAGVGQASRKPNGSRHKLSTRGETQALQGIKETDPAKYNLLRNFEALVREGKALQALDDFRAFGKLLGKDFLPGKSRKESIGRLMVVPAQLDSDPIRAALATMPPKTNEEDTPIRRWANQIMSGPPNPRPSGTLQP